MEPVCSFPHPPPLSLHLKLNIGLAPKVAIQSWPAHIPSAGSQLMQPGLVPRQGLWPVGPIYYLCDLITALGHRLDLIWDRWSPKQRVSLLQYDSVQNYICKINTSYMSCHCPLGLLYYVSHLIVVFGHVLPLSLRDQIKASILS